VADASISDQTISASGVGEIIEGASPISDQGFAEFSIAASGSGKIVEAEVIPVHGGGGWSYTPVRRPAKQKPLELPTIDSGISQIAIAATGSEAIQATGSSVISIPASGIEEIAKAKSEPIRDSGISQIAVAAIAMQTVAEIGSSVISAIASGVGKIVEAESIPPFVDSGISQLSIVAMGIQAVRATGLSLVSTIASGAEYADRYSRLIKLEDDELLGIGEDLSEFDLLEEAALLGLSNDPIMNELLAA
jgi:hypothetical protein